MSNLTLDPTDFSWHTDHTPSRDRDRVPAGVEPTGGRAGRPAEPEPAGPHRWERFAPTVAHVRPMSELTAPGHRAAKLVSALRVLLFVMAGAAPILAIPAQILGVPLGVSAVFAVVPLALAAMFGMLTEVNEGRWARTGMLTGLAAVATYDAVRMPLVASNIWPDFIPSLGGWVNGFGPDDIFVGYLWRYLGDGGGMGIVFFMLIGLLFTVRPQWITGREMTISIGYGVFIWTGLIGTLLLPGGQDHLFFINPANFALSLLGHLIYGAVLGLGLRLTVRRITTDQERAGRVPATA